jgi:hypothetical protein
MLKSICCFRITCRCVSLFVQMIFIQNVSCYFYLTSRQSAILRIVWTAMLCILGVGSPDLDRSSGSRRSTLRATSAAVTLSKGHHYVFWLYYIHPGMGVLLGFKSSGMLHCHWVSRLTFWRTVVLWNFTNYSLTSQSQSQKTWIFSTI